MPRLHPETLEAIRRRIEAAALGCFIQKGYAATTMREIARAAELTAGALYGHYDGKEGLFAAVVDRYRSRIVDAETPVRRVLDKSRFPEDIPELAAAIGALVREEASYWRLWYVDVIEFDGKHFQSALAPAALLENPGLRRRLDELRESGRLAVAPEVGFTMVYMHLFNYFLVETLFGAREHYGLPEDEAVDAMAAVFARGLLVKETE